MISIKRFFITVFSVWLVVVPIISLIDFIDSQGDVYWFAPLIGPLGILTYFAFVKWRRPFDSKIASLVITVMVAVCLLITVGQRFFDSEEILTPIFLALGSLVGWLLYDRWFVKLPQQSIQAENPGSWKFEDTEGNSKTLSNLKAPLKVLCFNMGNSDPYLWAQAEHYYKSKESFESRNAKIVFVSGDRQVDFSSEIGQSIEFWTDPNLENSGKLGITQAAITHSGFLRWQKKIATPTLIIVDQNNDVVFSKVMKDYRNRPDTDFILRILDANQR
jgi:peroxiredoxin